MQDEIRTAQISENGDSPYAVTISVSGHEWRGDKPVAAGGGNHGPAPYDLLLAALGECTAMTVRWYALKNKWPLARVEVHLTHRKGLVEGRTGPVDLFEKQLILHGAELSDEQIKKLHEIAAQCLLQKTLESSSVVTTIAAPSIL